MIWRRTLSAVSHEQIHMLALKYTSTAFILYGREVDILKLFQIN